VPPSLNYDHLTYELVRTQLPEGTVDYYDEEARSAVYFQTCGGIVLLTHGEQDKGGGLIGVSVSLPGPYFGISYGLKGLAVLVLGGLGSVPGAIAGGLLMGLAEALVPSAASGWRDALAFAILFAVLLLRPSGLLGRRTVEKV
jgi:hypothetical protein